jgi:hypothetical protein
MHACVGVYSYLTIRNDWNTCMSFDSTACEVSVPGQGVIPRLLFAAVDDNAQTKVILVSNVYTHHSAHRNGL